MLLQWFPVRSGTSRNQTGSSQARRAGSMSGLLTPAATGGPRARSLSASSPQHPSSHGAPRSPVNRIIQRACSPLGITPSTLPGSNHSASHTAVERHGGNITLETPSEQSLDDPIMAGVHRQRADSDDGYDMTRSLSPSESKRLKSALQSRLTACLLSHNLTAYVTDTHTNIMEFIKSHQEVFKMPAALIDDVELLAQLSRIISELLASICGNLKAKLVTSLAKRMSVMDAAKSLTHSIIEVDASHWNRYAFLRWCLQICLIGISDFKTIPLKDLYSTSLIPSLHRDLHVKIAEALNCNVGIDACETNEQHANATEGNTFDLDHQCSTGELGATYDRGDDLGECDATDDHGDNFGEGDHTMDNQEEDEFCENRDDEKEETGQQEPEVDDGGSGFIQGTNSKHPKFTSTKFWNFMDCSLKAIHKAAREEAGDYEGAGRGAYENAVQNILVEYFQMDLVEFPGSMVVPKLLATTSPHGRQLFRIHCFGTEIRGSILIPIL
ncbi:uncharacterized protein EDB91DRAFT_1254345 [Suillus paluster]|uniref:uncharacterized protein n=1 Tax=Suillus paluster TaxID=48578 RepID=UPI001B87CE59|nr:uncharacterized protein EDB91DRAFT_1254345 [Suillus paluster]KAG1726442.1 hypothetical protein EDB91DRAFT_1254345 [Suillus paluster]